MTKPTGAISILVVRFTDLRGAGTHPACQTAHPKFRFLDAARGSEWTSDEG
jgi:hypothetical protein